MTIEGHMGVANDGQVHYHPVPNLGFSSAVDLVKQLIDIFPDDFGTQAPGHPHGQEPSRPRPRGTRNAAHRGPVFLPWHRFMLILLELQLQRVLGDQDFGIPYWDWAADGELGESEQAAAPIWSAVYMGGQGNPVTTGHFAFDAADPTSWRVQVDADVQGRLRATNRGLRRAFGQFVPTLPRVSQVEDALALTTYDAPPWDTTSAEFRNRVEGWQPLDTAPGLHNRVHVWVGGDMLPSSSPNDPVFYLNHCNEDRIWANAVKLEI
ncbi:MAG: tyrosinase family protein [Pseudonocardiaceae bacterium]